MADPARYYIDATLIVDAGNNPVQAGLTVQRADSGDWVKWAEFEDYKNGQRANKSENSVTKLGLEIVALRTRLQDMEKAGNRMARALKRLAKSDYEDGEGVFGLLKEWEDANNA